jgi:signal transduction histidine kinase
MQLRHPREWRLRTRLTLGVVALLLPLQLLVIASYLRDVDARRANEIDDAIVVDHTVAAVVDGFIHDLESTTLAASLALGPSDEPLNQQTMGPYIRRLLSEYGSLRALFLTDLQGRVIVTASGEDMGFDLSSRSYVRALQAGADVVWTDGFSGAQTGEVTVALARSVRGVDGRPRAFMVAAFYPAVLIERLPGGMPQEAGVLLIDEAGSLLFNSRLPSLTGVNRDVSNLPEVRAALEGQTVRLQGWKPPFVESERYGALVRAPHSRWVVGFTRPQEPLEVALRERFLRDAAAISLVMLVAAALVALISDRLARPLGTLAEAAAAIARGERPEIPPVRGDVEVTQLAAAMGVMSRAVADREEDLQRLRQEAEDAAEVLRRLQAVTDTALTKLTTEGLLQELVDRLKEVLAVDTAALLLLDPATDLLVTRAATGLQSDLERTVPIPVGEGFAGRVAEARQTIVIDDVQPEEVVTPALRERGVRSLLGVPLMVDDQLIGVLHVGTVEQRRFSTQDAELLELAGSRAAVAIERARLYRNAQEAVALRDEFLSVAAHELKTPLTGMRLSTQLALRQLTATGEVDRERVRRGLEGVDQQVNKLSRLVSQLLDISRIQAGKLVIEPVPTDLVELVGGIVGTTQASTNQHQIVFTHNGPVTAVVDPLRVEQIVANLVDNAIKYSPQGGQIEVSVEDASEGWVRMSVRDHGIGIPEDRRAHLFNRFYQAHGEGHYGGMGLGLYISQQIVEQHEGSIAAEFPLDGGTRFVISMPTHAAAVSGARASE